MTKRQKSAILNCNRIFNGTKRYDDPPETAFRDSGSGGGTVKTGKLTKRAAALLLALMLSAGMLSAALAEAPAAPAPMDVDLIMAKNAIAGFHVMDKDGNLMEPYKAPEKQGRGIPDENGVEPDYRGVVGYVSLQAGWEVSQFNTFTQTPWQLPFYEEKNGEWEVTGSIKHKTPVLVVDQQIREGKGHKYYGYLQAVRLDNHNMIWIDVTQFVTVPYWTFDLKEAVKYGYCIAVYKNSTRSEPMDRKKHRGILPDGIRVLMCYTLTARYFSPDRNHNPLLGIVFKGKEKKDAYTRTFLFFNQADLTLIY